MNLHVHGPTLRFGPPCGPMNSGVDAAGRLLSAAARALDPATFHTLLTSYVGLGRQSFVVNLMQSGHAPPEIACVMHYRVRRVHEVDAATAANRLLGVAGPYPYNDAARGFVYIEMDVSLQSDVLDASRRRMVREVRFEYVLECDHDFAILGGEWVGNSKLSHPHRVWLPLQPTRVNVEGAERRPTELLALAEAAGSRLVGARWDLPHLVR